MNKTNFFAMLQRLARTRPKTAAKETCDFCAVTLFPQHRHLLEVANRKIICACDACALRFENVIGRFKLIPRDARALPDFQMSEAQWQNLALPINLVFIFQNGVTDKPAAIYPSPAGATESLLSLESWHTIVADNPGLEDMKPDVEALLINRTGNARDYLIAPIDVCFELVGLLRKNWRGFSGGKIVWLEIETFFARLREQSARIASRNFAEKVYA